MKKKVVEAEYQIDLLNNSDPAKNYVLSKNNLSLNFCDFYCNILF